MPHDIVHQLSHVLASFQQKIAQSGGSLKALPLHTEEMISALIVDAALGNTLLSAPLQSLWVQQLLQTVASNDAVLCYAWSAASNMLQVRQPVVSQAIARAAVCLRACLMLRHLHLLHCNRVHA